MRAPEERGSPRDGLEVPLVVTGLEGCVASASYFDCLDLHLRFGRCRWPQYPDTPQAELDDNLGNSQQRDRWMLGSVLALSNMHRLLHSDRLATTTSGSERLLCYETYNAGRELGKDYHVSLQF